MLILVFLSLLPTFYNTIHDFSTKVICHCIFRGKIIKAVVKNLNPKLFFLTWSWERFSSTIYETFLLKLIPAMHNDLQFSKWAMLLHIYSVAYTVHFLDCPSSALPIRSILIPFSIVSSKITFPRKPHLKKELSSPSQSCWYLPVGVDIYWY